MGNEPPRETDPQAGAPPGPQAPRPALPPADGISPGERTGTVPDTPKVPDPERPADEPWRVEVLLWVVIGLLVSFFIGVVATNLFKVTEGDRLAGLVISALFLHGAILAVVAGVLRSQRVGWSAAFGLSAPRAARAVLLTVGATVVALPVAWALQLLSAGLMKLVHVAPVAQQAVTLVQESVSLGPRLFMAVMALALAPMAEEVLFRGVVYSALRMHTVLRWTRLTGPARWVKGGICRWLWRGGFPHLAAWLRAGFHPWLLTPRPWFAALLTSAIFGAFHLNVMSFLPLAFFGLVLTWLYERTGNLLAPILAHSLFNLANFSLLVWGRALT
jgi:membrane protease YdiL (CAAX protease family)